MDTAAASQGTAAVGGAVAVADPDAMVVSAPRPRPGENLIFQYFMIIFLNIFFILSFSITIM